MPRYEQDSLITHPTSLAKKLEALNADGWRVFSIISTGHDIVMIYEREISEKEAKKKEKEVVADELEDLSPKKGFFGKK